MKVNVLSAAAMVVVVRPSTVSRRRAPAALAVPLIVTEAKQPVRSPVLVMIGAVPGAVVATVNQSAHGPASA